MASSQKRIDANRENARRSTGPRTRTGKDHARRNGIRHGLTATDLLLDDENPVEYRALVDATVTDLKPRSERENVLATHVANTLWRRQRLYRAEAAFVNVRTRALKAENPNIRNSAEATAILLTEPEDASRVGLLLRYITAAERACNRAVSDFFAVRYEMEEARDREIEAQRAASAAYVNAALADFAAEEARDRTRLNEVLAQIGGDASDEAYEDSDEDTEPLQSEEYAADVEAIQSAPQSLGNTHTSTECSAGTLQRNAHAAVIDIATSQCGDQLQANQSNGPDKEVRPAGHNVHENSASIEPDCSGHASETRQSGQAASQLPASQSVSCGQNTQSSSHSDVSDTATRQPRNNSNSSTPHESAAVAAARRFLAKRYRKATGINPTESAQ